MTTLVREKRIRWYGDPQAEVQPDAGDVLVYNEPGHPEWYELVLNATQVRGRKPENLWLVVRRFDLGEDGSIPEEIAGAVLDGDAGWFPAVRRRRR